MKTYRVMMTVSIDEPADSNHEIWKSVAASDEREALDKARELVRAENPEINPAKIWAWAIQRSRD
ncbi:MULTISPECIES: hypothetical protein [unclassified Lysobacter]|uniref:hypothetical protein n=1 Tax=unclassified Lysobacter TaxID=2635362 RepID=UPI001F564186|nr:MULTISPECIES: hypothetical protein [unclassified Lysobacter]